MVLKVIGNKELEVPEWQILPFFLHSCPVFLCATQPAIWIVCCKFNHNRRCILFLPLPHVQSLYSNRSQNKIAFFHLQIIHPLTHLTIIALSPPPFISYTYEYQILRGRKEKNEQNKLGLVEKLILRIFYELQYFYMLDLRSKKSFHLFLI